MKKLTRFKRDTRQSNFMGTLRSGWHKINVETLTLVMVHSVAGGRTDGRTDRCGWAFAWGRICCCFCIDRGQKSCAGAPQDADGPSIAPSRHDRFLSVTLIIVNLVILTNGEAYLQVSRLVLECKVFKTSWGKT
jgi:hypothetical protein